MGNEENTNNEKRKELVTCSCGHDINHPMVEAKGEYTLVGHFLVTFGISYRPLKVRYLCLKCRKYFYETKDKRVLNTFL